jgi:hypothetical protein
MILLTSFERTSNEFIILVFTDEWYILLVATIQFNHDLHVKVLYTVGKNIEFSNQKSIFARFARAIKC